MAGVYAYKRLCSMVYLWRGAETEDTLKEFLSFWKAEWDSIRRETDEACRPECKGVVVGIVAREVGVRLVTCVGGGGA